MYRIAPPGDEANVTMFSCCAKSSKSIDIGPVIARAASWNRAALAAYNLAARRWVDVFDERPPAWVIDDTDVEGADAFELRTVTSRNLTPGMSGRPLALTRDGRFAYLSVWRGDEHWSYSIVEIATQRRFVEPPERTGDPPVVAIGPLMLKASNAIHYTPSPGWRVVGPHGSVGDGERWWYRLLGMSHTAWSPSGAQLAGISVDELVIVDISEAGASVVSRARIA